MRLYRFELGLIFFLILLFVLGFMLGTAIGSAIEIKQFKTDCDTFGRVKFDLTVYECHRMPEKR